MLKNSKIFVTFVVIAFLSIFGITAINATDVNDINENEKNSNFEGFFDSEYSNEVYKFSDKDKKINLPFIRFSNERMIVDEEINKLGFCFSAKSIEITSKLMGIQTFFSSDTIRVNGDMEYGVLLSDGDIIIDSNISKNLILISSGTVSITENANINDDVIIICNKLEMNGTVNGSIIGSIDDAQINGNVLGDLRISTNNLSFGSDNIIKGNIYVTTYNEKLDISSKYPQSIVKLQEVKKENQFSKDKVFKMLLNCVIFALMYIVINKLSRKDIFKAWVNKVSKNVTTVLLSGTILLLAVIPMMFLLIILSIIGLWPITIPVLLIYIVYMIIAAILNIFVVGSLMYTYVKEKYIKTGGVGTDILGAFCSFLVLEVLTMIPFVGAYISIIMYIISIGIIFTLFLKNKKID